MAEVLEADLSDPLKPSDDLVSSLTSTLYEKLNRETIGSAASVKSGWWWRSAVVPVPSTRNT